MKVVIRCRSDGLDTFVSLSTSRILLSAWRRGLEDPGNLLLSSRFQSIKSVNESAGFQSQADRR